MIPQLAFVFPGQGSQSQGMLAELAAAHPLIAETFAEASEGAGVDLWQISLDNPEDRLNQTEFTQPALLAANIALWRLWQEQVLPQPAILSGHSLGEYAALVASGALSLKDGAYLVRLRGQFMQAAVPAVEVSRLLALVGVGLDAVRAFAVLLMLTAGLSIFVALLTALKEREGDMAMLRVIGASRAAIIGQVASEFVRFFHRVPDARHVAQHQLAPVLVAQHGADPDSEEIE